MKIDIQYKPSYAMALVDLAGGERIMAEGGALVSMSPGISIETRRSAATGGILKTLKTGLLGGESFWMNTYTAGGTGGQVALAPTLPGDIAEVDLNGTVFVQATSFLAGAPHLDFDTRFQGLRGFFSGESLFFLKISGTGPLLIASYGGLEMMEIDGSMVVDTGHIAAFDEGLSYRIGKVGGWKSLLFGGEGLVAHFSGKGRLWLQSRTVPGLSGWLRMKLPPRQQ